MDIAHIARLLQRIDLTDGLVKHRHFRFEHRIYADQIIQMGSVGSLHHHTQRILRQFHKLFNLSHRSEIIEVFPSGFFHFDILLCQKQNVLVLCHGRFNRRL